MEAELKYNGYTAQPSDYECQDGDLAAVLNLMPEKGTLHPVTEAKEVATLNENEKVLFIHETKQGNHYIILNTNDHCLYWIPENGTSATTRNQLVDYASYQEPLQVTAIGNTLIVIRENGMYYHLWKSGDGNYDYLGNKLPNVEISFGLVGHPRLYSVSDESHSTFTITFDTISSNDLDDQFSETTQRQITEQVLAKVNKFIANETVNKGRFCFPFFVRYALRLFDGSLVGHSAPILMCPSTKAAPIVFWKSFSGKKGYQNAECDIMLVAASLDYGLYSPNSLADWKDIIQGVDVFISKPIYTYDQNGTIKRRNDEDNFESEFIGRLYHANYDGAQNASLPNLASAVTEDNVLRTASVSGAIRLSYDSSSPVLKAYAQWKYSQIYALYFEATRTYPAASFQMPEYTEDKVVESISSCGTFYKLCSLSIDELLASGVSGAPTNQYTASSRKDIVVKDDYLQSLTTREAMTDDYLSHEQLRPERAFVYNSRLNLSGLKRVLFDGFTAYSSFAYCTHFINWKIGTLNGGSEDLLQPRLASSSPTTRFEIVTYIKENGQDYLVYQQGYSSMSAALRDYIGVTVSGGSNPKTKAGEDTYPEKMSWGAYVFYPNANAYKMQIITNLGRFEFALTPHEFLNGSYAFLGFGVERIANASSTGSYAGSKIVDVTNKLYTSEINNPFFFPLTNINTIGTGKILGIASAAKALSQGQFGQFPLYAFTTDGVWALEVSAATGAFSARQPITRDVCINADSITQIDSAVLFATDRGIMLLTGSNAECITDVIDNNEEPFIFTSMPLAANIQQLLGTSGTQVFPERPFTTSFLAGCQMLYSYNRQQIIVFNPSYAYAYVYSLESKQWGMMQSNIASRVISYPEALAMTDDNKLVDYSQEKYANNAYVVKSPQFLITRPLKLDGSLKDVHKTIDTIITRGNFLRGHVKTVLYGSRDLSNWFPIYTSVDHFLRHFRGTPYKYFRIALICSLTHDESIWGSSIQYTPKLTNQPR